MIVITTPTGNIGRRVVDGVLAAGAPARLIVRDASRLPAKVRENAEVVEGSHGDPDVVAKAFAGAGTVFWLAPPNHRAESLDDIYSRFAQPACEAFRSQGVQRVVAVSALGRGVLPDAGHITATLAMDDLIAGTGVHFRALTLPTFMDNLLGQAASIRDQGVFFSAISGDRKLPTCACRDIAAAAVRLLLDPSWTGRGEVPVLGPEDLSNDDMARIMSEVLGRPVRHQRVSVEAFKESMLARGVSEANAQGLVEMAVAKENGLDDTEPRTPEATSPTTFREWCEEELKPAVLA
ncbi:NAD(P)H-binding protein [Actinomadura verrucosospora]|uniref:NmrA family transcriptional regulator n=1 Tax=Actinomadura verrucosospora TaxID=46165 RepID=A0A7D4A0S1_ACTVE|nr:NAD(P)H-binding protein [Actinomadura verrucosospora]QKG19765.1 NmrA family transcriptional regulator [Actinomadura verrucosospora]